MTLIVPDQRASGFVECASSLTNKRLLDFGWKIRSWLNITGEEMCATSRGAMNSLQLIVGVARSTFVLIDRMKLLSNVQIRSEVEEFESMIDAFFQQEQRACFSEIHVQSFVNR
jgi:ABC-type phosphate/phosphonate transport system ATPase subunit